MNAFSIRRAVWAAAAALAIAVAAWMAWPQPIPVDLASATMGPMEVTVDDEARTRVRDVYVVSAPVAGKVLRTPRRVGDEVVAGETIVAIMQAPDSPFLDLRSEEALRAALAAADSAIALSEHEIERLEAALTLAQSDQARARALAATDVVAARALEAANIAVEANAHALAAAHAQRDMRQSERAGIAARLGQPADRQLPATAPLIQLRAPASGRVLAIPTESESVVAAGTPLIAIGDPRNLDVVADLLSTDAVQVEAGSAVRIDGWGGPPLSGQVARVDPAGFVKVSALGIEERRVRTSIDLIDPPETWSRLGDDYRVIVHVTVWRADEVVAVPVSALFRSGEAWAVFRVESGRARMVAVEVGHRNDRQAEILSGLDAGDRVVVHPSDRVADGSAVAER